jgi:hypothetical protein
MNTNQNKAGQRGKANERTRRCEFHEERKDKRDFGGGYAHVEDGVEPADWHVADVTEAVSQIASSKTCNSGSGAPTTFCKYR